MATYCPNPACNRKLKLSDWKPNCPECGTNVLYYKMNERLLAEADKVETANAAFQKKADRAKAAVKGSKWAVVRMVLLALPLFALLIPMGTMAVSLPFVEKSVTISAVSIVTGLVQLNSDALLAALENSVLQVPFLWFMLGIAGFVLVLLAALGGLATSWLACSPGGFKRTIAFFAIGIGGTALGAASLYQFGAAIPAVMPGAVTVEASWYGPGAVALAFLLILAVNIYIKAAGGIPVEHKQCYISGFPEQEVYDNLAKGLTLDDMRKAYEKAEAEEAAETEF